VDSWQQTQISDGFFQASGAPSEVPWLPPATRDARQAPPRTAVAADTPGDLHGRSRSPRRLGAGVQESPPATSEPVTPAPTELNSTQILLIRIMLKGAHQFDPAQDNEAGDVWAHKIQLLDVRKLLQTHSDVSETFGHGPHKGQSVRGLAGRLVSGEEIVDDLTPLVVIKFVGDQWVVFCGQEQELEPQPLPQPQQKDQPWTQQRPPPPQ
jgi:hypothetical protein